LVSLPWLRKARTETIEPVTRNVNEGAHLYHRSLPLAEVADYPKTLHKFHNERPRGGPVARSATGQNGRSEAESVAGTGIFD
jgi:hypothetical protein